MDSGASLLSIVVPVFNEQGNLLRLHEELTSAARQIALPYEIVYVDDGSTDASYERLVGIYRTDEHVTVIRHRRNLGQTMGLVTGFNHARGDVIVTIDADLQHDPNDITKLLDQIRAGADAVVGWRANRRESYLRRTLPSRTMNLLARRLLGLNIHDFGCGLKAYRAECIRNVVLEGEGHLYLPAAVAVRGYNVYEVKIGDRARASGSSKLGAVMMLRQLLDLLFFWFLLRYWRRPLHFFGSLGLGLLVSGVTAGVIHIVRFAIDPSTTLMSPLLLLSVFLSLAGIQFITTGVLFEIEMRPHARSFDAQPERIVLSHVAAGVQRPAQ